MRITTPFIAIILGVSVVTSLQAASLKQVYSKPRVIKRGDYADPYYGRHGGRVCPRWCLEDRNPCDPRSSRSPTGDATRTGDGGTTLGKCVTNFALAGSKQRYLMRTRTHLSFASGGTGNPAFIRDWISRCRSSARR
jgi:hypothetical protein